MKIVRNLREMTVTSRGSRKTAIPHFPSIQKEFKQKIFKIDNISTISFRIKITEISRKYQTISCKNFIQID